MILKTHLMDSCLEMRSLVESLHDQAFVINQFDCVERTEEGKVLFQLLVKLDLIRNLIKHSDISKYNLEEYI